MGKVKQVKQMNIIVPIKFVPDLVEELKINATGASLDPDWLRLKLNEFDDHAIEEAILLKERGLGTVIVIAPEADCADDTLYAAVARGVDRVIKLKGEFGEGVSSHILARLLAAVVQELQPGLILTGVQAHNDLDGPVGPLLAENLGLPYVGYIAGVDVGENQVIVRKELPGGLSMEMGANLPAVLGIQVAEQPPRYVAVSKIRQAMKTATIEEQSVLDLGNGAELSIGRIYQPESTQKAEMLEGDANAVAARLVEIFTKSGVL
jgi:electron transfer flavoprotein beta subunit